MQNQLSDTFSYSPPVAPDTSRQAYDAASGPRTDGYNFKPGWSPLGTTLGWWFNSRKNRNYEQWKLNLENEYDRAYSEWQTYMSSPEAQKQAYESADYNANYADPGSMSPASPGSYQHIEEDPARDNVMSLFQNLFSVIQGIQGLQSGALDIQHKEIENSWLDRLLGTQYDQSSSKVHLISQQTDNAELMYHKLLASVFAPEDFEKYLSIDWQGQNQWPGVGLGEMLARGPLAKGLDLKNEQIDEMIESLGLKNMIDQPIADMAGANAGLKIFGGVASAFVRLLVALALKK